MTLLALLLAPAARAELPWECPVIVLPEDAFALRDTDAGLDAVGWQVYALASAWVDEGCAWVETTSGDGVYDERRERLCETAESTVAIAEWWGTEWDHGAVSWSGWELEVTVPAGETWTRILVRGTDDTASEGDWTLGPRRDVRAEWDGAVEGNPYDGWFETASGSSSSWPYISSRRAETPACVWQWSLQDDGDYLHEEVIANGTSVEVGGHWTPGCRTLPIWGTVDGVGVGAVERDTWALDPADVDRDGVLPACDCDEGDPTVNPYAVDTPGDGVDQDCDGADGRAEPDGDDPADTAGDTGPTDTDPADTGADEAPSGGPEPDRPIASTIREETKGCFGGATAALFALGPVAAARRRRRG